MGMAEAGVERIEVSTYRIPTGQPESDRILRRDGDPHAWRMIKQSAKHLADTPSAGRWDTGRTVM